MFLNITSFDFSAQREATYLGDEVNTTTYSRMVGWENVTAFGRKLLCGSFTQFFRGIGVFTALCEVFL